jgi:hypothetical protein
MRTLAMVVLLMAGLPSYGEAGRRGGGGSAPSSRSSSQRSSGASGTGSSSSSHAVGGYTKKNGTQVAPHRQTDPDGTQRNNYSTRGNVNPSTGKVGTKPAVRQDKPG